jgi:hypothetical protein
VLLVQNIPWKHVQNKKATSAQLVTFLTPEIDEATEEINYTKQQMHRVKMFT